MGEPREPGGAHAFINSWGSAVKGQVRGDVTLSRNVEQKAFRLDLEGLGELLMVETVE